MVAPMRVLLALGLALVVLAAPAVQSVNVEDLDEDMDMDAFLDMTEAESSARKASRAWRARLAWTSCGSVVQVLTAVCAWVCSRSGQDRENSDRRPGAVRQLQRDRQHPRGSV